MSFGRRKIEMNEEEWESLCDGCARCCLHKFEEVQTENSFTRALFAGIWTVLSCSEYSAEKELVPNCVKMTPVNLETLKWMPSTCAYRKILKGNR